MDNQIAARAVDALLNFETVKVSLWGLCRACQLPNRAWLSASMVPPSGRPSLCLCLSIRTRSASKISISTLLPCCPGVLLQ